jgi:putative pyruvate formate lyase activating enzyme
MTTPGYIRLHKNGELKRRAEQALLLLNPCRLCPRECGVDRTRGEKGYCNTGRLARVASFSPHFGEEDPLVGRNGSGTIFISSCNLLCTFCQNFEISHGNEGMEVTPPQMASMMMELARAGCHNINIVTSSHVVPQLLEALVEAVPQGLDVPLIYNTGGYDRVETLKLLDGVFDIYMPDFKFWRGDSAQRCCHAPDYPEIALEAIREMHRQVGLLSLDEQGIATGGLLVRHLVLPGQVAGTSEIMKALAREISPHTYVNVMDQYRPCGEVLGDPILGRRLTPTEFREAMEGAKSAGLDRLDPRVRGRLFFRLP